MHRHRVEAGNRIGDGRHVDLLAYADWLHEKRHTPKPISEVDPYAKLKESARARNAAIALAGRDIGELPAVENPERKAKAAGSFRAFCEVYFRLTFHLEWSPDHLKVINKIEEAVIRGGLFSLAMARGSGKSSLAEVACIWAVLNGYRDFVCLIGSDEGHACDMLDSIKTELDSNDLLAADYPEVCFPIQALDGIANRANGQLFEGKRTQIGWTAKEIVLPTIAGSKASGAIIKVAGLTGRIRGMKFKRPDGKTVRPSLVVLDDPQTDESARSLSQCANREAILAGAVLGLAGPGKKISGIMPCTVIRPGDMADNILNRDLHPEWNGERTRMVNAFPINETLWQRYAEIRAEGLRAGDGGAAGTEFYRRNREAMDAGADVSWKERFNHDELSAIQHAMNLKLQDEAAFFAEYQNEPLPEETVGADQLTAEQVAAKINNLPRNRVPIAGNHLTAFIDVQGKLLFYVVAAWEDDFTGYVVDYGTYPDQQRTYFTLRDARHTLATAAEGTGLEGSIYAGLESLTNELLGREWQRDDGAAMKIGRCLIDANWGHSTNVVYQFCRQSSHASILLPSHGRFVGASSNPFSEYKRRPGDRVGLNWRVPTIHGKRAIRHVIYDTNWWKSFTHARLAVAMGDRGCLSIFGDRPDQHRMFAEQVTAEYYVRTEGRGRTVDEWKARPEQPDNHWLDCLVGSAVAASMQSALLFGTDIVVKRRSERVSFREMQQRKRN
ncbi:terminase gpA endonuclease subunit [Crateriforma spongiae]|uniref:terminase gpA endonuclease subunit n=1 Tax=Crateriforma spongiae TaxID=2724528 RepID=UPI0039AF8673